MVYIAAGLFIINPPTSRTRQKCVLMKIYFIVPLCATTKTEQFLGVVIICYNNKTILLLHSIMGTHRGRTSSCSSHLRGIAYYMVLK